MRLKATFFNVFIAVFGLVLAASSATAAAPADFSVTDQYRETIPGITGGDTLGEIKKNQRKGQAKNSPVARLESGGGDAAALAEFVLLTVPKPPSSGDGEAGANPAAPGARLSDSSGTPASSSAIADIAEQASTYTEDGAVGLMLPVLLLLVMVAAIGYSVAKFRNSRLSQ